MIHSICVIDDGIPTEQEKLVDIDTEKQLDTNTLRFLLREEIQWASEEEGLKNLIQKLIEDKEKWTVSAFKHPQSFENSVKNELIRPEIIVYDWEFHAASTDHQIDHKAVLSRILNESFAIVFVYSGADKEDEIQELINSKPFEPFKNRIKFIDKVGLESGKLPEEILIKEVSDLRDDSFSFKFGTKIRQKSIEAVDRILVNLGKATLQDVSAYFRLTDDTKRDLVDFIGERFKSRLHGLNLEDLPDEAAVPAATYDEMLAKELWANRLYFDPGESDNITRRGDIIYKDADGEGKLYLVISADCDLDKFWHKNFGNINLIPLVKINDDLKNELCATVEPPRIKSDFKQRSLTSKIDCLVEGPFVLPFIKIDGDFCNYFACPKEIFSLGIAKPTGLSKDELKNERLKYKHWVEYKRLLTVSEPFLSPLIEHILKSLSGYGVPDYPDNVRETIYKISKEALG